MQWLKTINDMVKSFFTTTRAKMPAIPSFLLLCEIKNRPGLSALAITAAIVQKLPDYGIPILTNPDGTPNKTVQLTSRIVKEIVEGIKTQASIESVVDVGSIITHGLAMTPAGSMPVTTTNETLIKVFGLCK